MAAYAALVSLTHVIEQVELYHARQPVFSDKQLRQLGLLHEKVSFLQDFLENYDCSGSQKEEDLKIRTRDAAYKAEDIIETYIVDHIHAPSGRTSSDNKSRRPLHNVIEDLCSIEKEVMKIKEGNTLEHQMSRYVNPIDSLRPVHTEKDTAIVFGEELNQIMDKLTGPQPDLQVISITGMGGIGKTTLAKKIYENRYIVEMFDMRGWVTISQEHNEKDMLLCLLQCLNGQREQASLDYHELGKQLYQSLYGRKYLIVIDDIWSIEAWKKLESFLPNTNNNSRVMVTTRLLNVAQGCGSCDVHRMNLLDENESWSLLCTKVFSQEACPPELEELGKEIATNCKGLPLSIVVIGSLLAKSKVTREYWEYIAKNTSSTINSEEDEGSLNILYLSYNHLPVHLKPCFLYMGIYEEDQEIRIPSLIKLWVSEGFLKPQKPKNLEEVAKEYLKDLIDRNLILVSQLGRTGNIKYCKIHDLVRDFCLREAQKERFLCVIEKHNHDTLQKISSQRRVALHKSYGGDMFYVPGTLRNSFTRSFIYNGHLPSWNSVWLSNFRLLRVLVTPDLPIEAIYKLVYSRYICCFQSAYGYDDTPLPLYPLWNLQTLYLKRSIAAILPSEIWTMPQLRHINIEYARLPDPPSGRSDRQGVHVLKNLQTLSTIIGFRCTEEILQKIPNIKKLGIYYEDGGCKDVSYYGLNNIGRLYKLQSLYCCFPYDAHHDRRADFFQNLSLPLSLKKLTLLYGVFDWEDVTTKIGSLPYLETLFLGKCYGREVWNTVPGKFLSLKFLELQDCNMECWTTEDEAHFPCLEQLNLSYMDGLMRIPSCIGDVATIRSIRLYGCRKSLVDSAKEILEEQHSMGNEDLRVVVDGVTIKIQS